MATETERGHFGAIWQNEHKFLPYKRPELTSYQQSLYDLSGYKDMAGAIKFNAEVYDEPVVPLWARDIGRMFGLYEQTFVFLKLNAFDIAPPHKPSIVEYCETRNADPDDVYFTILMMEDWHSGQYLEINNIGYTNWKKGDWFKFQSEIEISYGNVGKQNIYMLFATGKDSYIGQLEHLFPFNIPNVWDMPESTHPILQLSILPLINPRNDNKIMNMVYMHNGEIESLKEYTHDDKGRDKINQWGLTIWLFEPMCGYMDGEEFTQGFYSEFSTPYDTKRMRSKELDSILEYQQRNGILPQMITIRTGEYNVKDHFPYYSQQLQLVCDDLYVKTQNPIVGLTKKLTPDYFNHQFDKYFVSFNWRFTKHRQLLSNFLASEEGYLSWYFKDTYEQLLNGCYFDLRDWKHSAPEIYDMLVANNTTLQNNAPYIIDKPAQNAENSDIDMWPIVEEYKPGQTPSLYNTKETTLINFYKNIFVDIVTETRFAQPSANFSEKLLQPVQYMKPFILLAPPHTLEYFKSFGYQTFSDFWDESYDDIEDHGERLKVIFQLIHSILNRPLTDLHAMYSRMMPVLQHNEKLFLELTASPNYNNTEFHG